MRPFHTGLFAILLSACVVHAQTTSVEDVAAMEVTADDARLREVLKRTPPSRGSTQEMDTFYGQQTTAARRLGEFDLGLSLFRQWFAAAPQSNIAPFSLWRNLFRSDRQAESNVLGEQLLKAAEKAYDHEYVRVGARLARDFSMSGRLQDAQALLERIEPRTRTMEGQLRATPENQFWLADTRAKWHQSRCELSQALARYAQALPECVLALDMYRRKFDLRGAMPEYLQGSAATDRTDSLIDMASLQLAMGRYFDAEQTIAEALTSSAQAGARNGRDIVGAYNSLALVRAGQSRIVEARQFAQRALRFASTGDRGKLGVETRNTYDVLFRIMVMQRAWQEAATEFGRIDTLSSGDPALQSRVRYPLARALAYAHTGRSADAVALMTDHLQWTQASFGNRHVETGLAQGVLGIVLASSTDGVLRARARGTLASAVQLLARADSTGRDTLDLSEKASVRSLIFERYLEVIGADPAKEDIATSFAASDALRGSSVQQALGDAAVRSAAHTSGLSELVRRAQDAGNELKALYGFLARQASETETRRVDTIAQTMRKRIQELEESRVQLQAEIARGFPEYSRLVHPDLPTPADVAGALHETEAFIAIFPTEQHTFVWAVRRDGTTAFHRAEMGEREQLKLVDRLRRTLDVADKGSSMPAFDAPAAAELYDGLLRPISHIFSGQTHLVVAAGGGLAQIPFAVLAPSRSADDLSPPRWLIQEFAITQVPSASAWMSLKQLAQKERAPEILLGWADPAFGLQVAPAAAVRPNIRRLDITRETVTSDRPAPTLRSAWRYDRIPALPETRDELQAIAATLHADPVGDLRVGALATRESVLAASRSGQLARKRVVIFATHGLIAGDLPNLNQPALAMAATGAEEQEPLSALLTLDDVVTLQLNADWVVLSACNTAAADGKAGEALSGLARGFFYAGSRSVLVTHWAVETDSAKYLTTATFDHHAKTPTAGKAESLRQAMLQLMAQPQYSHPAYWAPYALVGDGAR